MRLPVLVAADGADWEAGLVSAFERAELGVVIARRCVDVVELLGLAGTGQGRVALLSATLRRLDADAVDRLHAAEVTPVAVIPRGDSAAEERMRGLGIAHLVPADADPRVVAGVLAEAARAVREDAPAGAARAFADPSRPLRLPPRGPHGTDGTPAADLGDGWKRNGAVVAVWGPTGAPGRTTLAVTLADELARLNRQTLLVDADVYGATVAPALGLLDESPGLAAACRQAAVGRLDAPALAALSWQLTPRLKVLTGLPLAARWPELRPSGVAAVLAAARELADHVVVDCGFCLEADEELSYDTVAPRRNGATLAALDDADLVLAVGSADPIGMQRLVRGLADLADLQLGAPVRVVLNRVRRGAVPGDPASELRAALERFAGRTPAALLPADGEALDAALATGRTLAEARPASPLRRAIVELAAELAGVPVPPVRRRG